MLEKLIIFSFLGLLFILPGCQQQTENQVGIVAANPAYLKYFGEPPRVSKGRAYARVGYLPLTEYPQKVSVIPLYLFSENNQLEQILERLTGEMMPFLNSRFYQPLAVEDQLQVNPVIDHVLTLEITTKREINRADLSAIALSLTETALQFPGIKLVRLLLNGEPFPLMPTAGFSTSPQKISDPGPPALIVVAGVWEKDSEDMAELLINFDRPVVINNLKLTDSSGKKIEGEYFRSIFDMAVVVHPLESTSYDEGTKIQVQWDVTDKLGRSSRGNNRLSLKRLEH
ncbi:MAG: hypothetical protein GQ563_05620 [Desulfuromusa sp.]|nr:hypothetical protein [Desulfuromusa sp.]